MRSVSLEVVLDAAVLGVYTLLAGALTLAGAFIEYTSLQHFSSGELMVAAWLAAMGAILLYAGLYGVGYGKVLSRLRTES